MEHHHFTVFAVPETIIFDITLPTADLLSRLLSSAISLRSSALSRPSHSSSLRRGAFFTLPWRSGVSGRPECQPNASYIQSIPETGIFTPELPSALQRPAFSRSSSPSSLRRPAFFDRARSGAPHFHLARGTYIPTKIWGEFPPPPGSPPLPSIRYPRAVDFLWCCSYSAFLYFKSRTTLVIYN